MRVSGVSRVSTHGTPKLGNGITEIMQNSVSQALPKPSSRNVFSLVPDLDSEITPKEAADPESAVFMATDLPKKTESGLSSTSPFPPSGRAWNGISSYLCYRVTEPRLPWGFTLATVSPCPRVPRLGRPGEAMRGALSNPYGQGVGELTDLPVVRS
jgi:hypothetical protein